MLRLIKYVIQDARICPALMKFFKQFNKFMGEFKRLKMSSKFMCTKRGNKSKCWHSIWKRRIGRNYVIPFYTKPKDEDEDEDDDGKKNYQGATVLKVLKGLYKDISILDFKSLYPSIMITYNICHTTFRLNDDTRVKDEDCHIAQWSEHIRCEHDPEFKGKKKRKGDKSYCGDHKYRFIKCDDDPSKEGLLPLLLKELLSERKKVKKQMFVYENKWKELKLKLEGGNMSMEEKNEMIMAERRANVLDARQLAIKVSANSAYGFMGALTGYFPLICGAASVTYYGRDAIQKTITMVEARYPKSEVIYGDSVTGDTPLLLRRNGVVEIKTIRDLGDAWTSYEGFKVNESNRRDKQQCLTEYESWTDSGWAKIKRVIRHKCDKTLYRVNTRFGCVDVTKDHSLLDSKLNIINAKDLNSDTILLSSFPPILGSKNCGMVKCRSTSKLKAMKLYYTYKSSGHNIQVEENNGMYYISTTKETTNYVNKMMKLGKTDDFVYDLETESGRFHAGVGELIVKNTDSVFVDFHEPDLKQAFKVAYDAGEYVTNQLPGVLELEMENFYSPLLLLTKKRYEYSIINDDGKVLKDGSKGSINKRRDNCDAARDIYTYTLKAVMSGKTQDETVYEINQRIVDLFRGRAPLHNFVIYKGLKQAIEEYKNCAGHVLFAKRLEDRGNVLKAGTRLEYVFIEKYDKKLKSGDIMEDWSYFLMNRHSLGLRIDYGYYLEHNIMKPITEVLNIAYPLIQRNFYKPDEAFKMAMDAYLKPAWAKMLRGHNIEKKALYISKHTKNKKLRNAARTYAARSILNRLYRQHGLRVRAYHRPKNGQSHIFLNDKIIQQVASYHRDWAAVKNQINDKINLPAWIEMRW